MRFITKSVKIIAIILIVIFTLVSCNFKSENKPENNITSENNEDIKETSNNKTNAKDQSKDVINDNTSSSNDDEGDFVNNPTNIKEPFDSSKYNPEEIAVLNAFIEAEKTYAWFTGHNWGIGTKGEDSTIEIDSNKYYEVDFNNIKSLDDLKDYLSNFFDDKTIDNLFNIKIDFLDKEYDIFIEANGKLYYFGGYAAQVGIDGVSKEFTKIIKDNENRYTISVDMTWTGIYGTGPFKYTSYDYIYEKINDKWIFTNFVLPIQYCVEVGVDRPENYIIQKSPDNQYKFQFNKEHGVLSLYKYDLIMLSYLFESDGIAWDPDFMELQDFWWDIDFNKLYILVGPNINPVSDIYCVDLEEVEISYYDTIRIDLKNINKTVNYIYYSERPNALDVITANEDFYLNKKYGNYIYNLRTNEKFYLNDDNNNMLKFNNTSIEFMGSSKNEIININSYVDVNRIKYIENIRDAIKMEHNNNILNGSIFLYQIFSTDQGNYQIVKLRRLNNTSYYELWKIDNNKFERVIEQADNIFLTDNHKYLCVANKNGDFKVYDNKFNTVIEQNIYSERLLNKYSSNALELGDYYIMNFDEHIFLTIKSKDMLVDVVNINLASKEINSLPYEIEFNYNNHFINSNNGYMIYQTGPSISYYSDNDKRIVLDSKGAQRSLMAINLLNTKQVEIDNAYCLYIFYIEAQKDSLTYNKYVNSIMSFDTEKTYYFDKDFIGE